MGREGAVHELQHRPHLAPFLFIPHLVCLQHVLQQEHACGSTGDGGRKYLCCPQVGLGCTCWRLNIALGSAHIDMAATELNLCQLSILASCRNSHTIAKKLGPSAMAINLISLQDILQQRRMTCAKPCPAAWLLSKAPQYAFQQNQTVLDQQHAALSFVEVQELWF